MTSTNLTILAAVFGLAHIYFDYAKNIKATYVFKPLVCATLIGMVAFFGQAAPEQYRYLIMAGLFFSMLGDICLMLEREKFIQGLVSFLLAHILYLLAFSHVANLAGPHPWLLIALLVVSATLVWRYLYSSLGDMNIAVVVYITAIVLMCASAATWMTQSSGSSTLHLSSVLAFAGSLWFMASDTNLSINRFKHAYAAGQLVTLFTYYLAQILIAWSVLTWG